MKEVGVGHKVPEQVSGLPERESQSLLLGEIFTF
jgi:hypothetical protein